MPACSSGGSSYRSLSTGSILLRIPSRPASSWAEKARYGFADGSGQRNSMRLAFGFEPVIGIRMQAERFRDEYTRLTGASKPGTSRWYEFTVGLVKASSDGACFSRPPMYQRATSDRPPYPDSS